MAILQDNDDKTETRTQDIQEDNADNGIVGGDNQLRSELAKGYKTAQDAMRYFSLDWDDYEDLLFVQSRTPDNAKARLGEGSLSSIVIERAGRVMSQMPTGSVQALGLQNQGKGLLMDLILEKYIYPNAKEQYDMETKLFMWDMYSNVYGVMPMVYDWTDTKNYTGPDCWLVPIRNFFPQQGRFSIENCDFVFISTWQSRQFLADLVDDEVEDYDLDAIQEIMNETKEGKTMPSSRYDYLRNNPMWELRRRAPFTDTGQIEVVTKYEAGVDGRWIDFCPDFGNRVIRNIKNPHKSGRIPVVLKHALPTLDSIVGLGDMEKGRFMQYSIDTVLNLLQDGIKLRTYPPIKVVNGNVVMPTLRFQPGAKWLVSNPNDISHHQFPDVDNNNDQLLAALHGSLNNVTGTTTTQSSAESSSSAMGKTPQAIKGANQDQSTRDEIDGKLMSKSIQELFGNMINLINDVDHTKPIELYMFGEEIAQIAEDYQDIKDAVKLSKDGKTAKITIKPSRIKNEKGYVYKVDPFSTEQKDMAAQHVSLTEIVQSFVENPEAYSSIQSMLQMSGKTLDGAELFTEWLKTGGTRDWKKLIKPIAQATPPGQQGPPNAMSQGGTQGGAPVPSEAINIKDLPPAGAVQMAAQAGIQLTPQDFIQDAEQESALKTKSQATLKGIPPPAQELPQVPQAPVAPSPGMINDPDIAQTHAQISAAAQHFDRIANGG
jgi:hypothetical protein